MQSRTVWHSSLIASPPSLHDALVCASCAVGRDAGDAVGDPCLEAQAQRSTSTAHPAARTNFAQRTSSGLIMNCAALRQITCRSAPRHPLSLRAEARCDSQARLHSARAQRASACFARHSLLRKMSRRSASQRARGGLSSSRGGVYGTWPRDGPSTADQMIARRSSPLVG